MSAPETYTGNRGLQMEEPLIFEANSAGLSGVDFPEADMTSDRLGGIKREGEIGLPGMAEPQVVRHYLRLSQKNYSIDAGFYPLGSCTMKHNPRLNEKMARLPGFAGLHPLQPETTTQGALELIDATAHWLATLTGLSGVAMSPAAGAHGELTGLMTIRAALEDRGDARKRVLVPESAHGTNPASAHACGYVVESIPANERGRVDFDALRSALDTDVAALMLTNPNTCGLFEDEIIEIAEAVHTAGAFFYCDGANFNAIVGRVRPGDLGIDCMHINLHKTFSTPHGGGGPGSGPVGVVQKLVEFLPTPKTIYKNSKYDLCYNNPNSIGKLHSFYGNVNVLIKAYCYIRTLGANGLKETTENAVLLANYMKTKLSKHFDISTKGLCKHEFIISLKNEKKEYGIKALDVAKRLIDYGYHPPTIYFPLIVPEALMIEPTETETIESVDGFIETMIKIKEEIKNRRSKMIR